MFTPVVPFAVQPGEGTDLETPTGDMVAIKAATRQTNGSLSVLEFVISPKRGPALHTHLREDELWYVIDGDFRFKAGDAMLRASTGGLAFGPRGMPHAFQNIGDTPGRLLVITTPSGLVHQKMILLVPSLLQHRLDLYFNLHSRISAQDEEAFPTPLSARSFLGTHHDQVFHTVVL